MSLMLVFIRCFGPTVVGRVRDLSLDTELLRDMLSRDDEQSRDRLVRDAQSRAKLSRDPDLRAAYGECMLSFAEELQRFKPVECKFIATKLY